MKKIILGLTLLASISVFAEDDLFLEFPGSYERTIVEKVCSLEL